MRTAKERMGTDLDSLIEQAAAHAVRIRHQIHRHPELGYEERRTSELVRDELTELAGLGVSCRAGLAGGTGVLGYLPATDNAEGATTIALRADMDALPIQEQTGAEYASQTPGVMHACGHDGHTAILLGTARVLANTPTRRNNVLLIFQPAEEGGAGGDRMCREGVLDGSVLGTPVDLAYGLHGWPGLDAGRVSTRTGPLLAATDEFDITVQGKGGHAAHPDICVDPIVVASSIVTALQTVVARSSDPHEAIVLTVGRIEAGHTYNVIPEYATLSGTLRTFNTDARDRAEQALRRICTNVSAAYGATVSIDWHRGYPVTNNDPGATERFFSIAQDRLGSENVILRKHPSMGGEDFSFYARRIPSCFYFVGLRPDGNGSYPDLHTPRFDFNDDVVSLAIGLMSTLALAPA